MLRFVIDVLVLYLSATIVIALLRAAFDTPAADPVCLLGVIVGLELMWAAYRYDWRDPFRL